jgi:hypothetical protein
MGSIDHSIYFFGTSGGDVVKAIKQLTAQRGGRGNDKIFKGFNYVPVLFLSL